MCMADMPVLERSKSHFPTAELVRMFCRRRKVSREKWWKRTVEERIRVGAMAWW